MRNAPISMLTFILCGLGCGSSRVPPQAAPLAPAAADAAAKQWSASPDRAVVYVFRPTLAQLLAEAGDTPKAEYLRATGGQDKHLASVSLSGVVVGVLAPGQFFRVEAEPGKHIIKWEGAPLHLALEAGPPKFVVVEYGQGPRVVAGPGMLEAGHLAVAHPKAPVPTKPFSRQDDASLQRREFRKIVAAYAARQGSCPKGADTSAKTVALMQCQDRARQEVLLPYCRPTTPKPSTAQAWCAQQQISFADLRLGYGGLLCTHAENEARNEARTKGHGSPSTGPRLAVKTARCKVLALEETLVACSTNVAALGEACRGWRGQLATQRVEVQLAQCTHSFSEADTTKMTGILNRASVDYDACKIDALDRGLSVCKRDFGGNVYAKSYCQSYQVSADVLRKQAKDFAASCNLDGALDRIKCEISRNLGKKFTTTKNIKLDWNRIAARRESAAPRKATIPIPAPPAKKNQSTRPANISACQPEVISRQPFTEKSGHVFFGGVSSSDFSNDERQRFATYFDGVLAPPESLLIASMADVNAMLQLERTKDQLGCDDVSCALDLAGALGTQYYLDATVEYLGGIWLVTAKVFDTQSSRQVAKSTLQVARTSPQQWRTSSQANEGQRCLRIALKMLAGEILE